MIARKLVKSFRYCDKQLLNIAQSKFQPSLVLTWFVSKPMVLSKRSKSKDRAHFLSFNLNSARRNCQSSIVALAAAARWSIGPVQRQAVSTGSCCDRCETWRASQSRTPSAIRRMKNGNFGGDRVSMRSPSVP